MTPVFQDKSEGVFPYGGGNCLQAAVASLLDLPLEAVPHFMQFGRYWATSFRLFLREHGLRTEFIWDELPPNGDYELAIIEGTQQPCDYSHAVIYKDGKMAHDPKEGYQWDGYVYVGYYKMYKRDAAYEARLTPRNIKVNSIHCTCPNCKQDFDIEPAQGTVISK